MGQCRAVVDGQLSAVVFSREVIRLAFIKYANMGLSFLLELAMLAAFGYWGFNTASNPITQIGLGVGTPVLVASVWGIWLAPKSPRRLRDPFYLVLTLIIFGLAIIALAIAGQPNLALMFAIIYAINVVLQYVLK